MKPCYIFLFLLASFASVAQNFPGFNYQGIARDELGAPLADQEIGIRIDITSDMTVESSEQFHVQTNQFGLFSLVVGQGDLISGSFESIDWSTLDKYMVVAIDVGETGTYITMERQLLKGVPYALFAKESGQQVTISGSGGTTVTGMYPDFVISSVDQVDDADPDPTNELISGASLQTGSVLRITDVGGDYDVDLSSLSVDNQTLADVLGEGSDANGTVVSNLANPADSQDAATKGYVDGLSIDDADADPANELQDLSSTSFGTDRTISIAGGTATTISVADDDNDSANEIQDLSLSSNILSLSSDATSVDLSGYLDNTDGQELSLSTNTLSLSGGTAIIDLSPYLDNTDEQDLGSSASGTDRTITIVGGVSTTISVADNDNNPSNEFVTGASYQAGNVLRITDGGGDTDVSLSTLNADLDAASNMVVNLAAPTAGTDAANKNYVDVAASALQSEVDATQTGTGLGATGAYTANPSATYINSSSSLQDADNNLDAQVATNTASIATVATNLLNTYAFSSQYAYSNITGATTFDVVDISTTVNYDGFGMIVGDQIQILEDGIYLFNISGTTEDYIQVSLRSNGNNVLLSQAQKQVKPSSVFYHDNGQFQLSLSTGDYLEIVIESAGLGDIGYGTIFGRKL